MRHVCRMRAVVCRARHSETIPPYRVELVVGGSPVMGTRRHHHGIHYGYGDNHHEAIQETAREIKRFRFKENEALRFFWIRWKVSKLNFKRAGCRRFEKIGSAIYTCTRSFS